MAMSRKLLCCMASLLFAPAAPMHSQQPRISQDRDLTDLDLSGWNCIDQLEGTAKTEDGAERNRGKNRSAIDLSGLAIPNLDTAGFLKQIGAFDAQTKWKRRKDLSAGQKTELAALEKQIVSLTGYINVAYAGPPETTNCASVDMHDWHLEVFEKPSDHPSHVGDPTGIVCEITPRTQQAIYRAGIRLQNLAGFIRRPDLGYEPTGHAAKRVRLTGYLLWDDEHNGRADLGPAIQSVGANGYSHPWRTTAWEMHPVMKIEPLEGAPIALVPPPASTPSPAALPPAPVATAPTAPPQTVVTIIEPVKIKIPYGETVLPRGMKLDLISRDARNATVRYMGQTVLVPLQSTDLH